MPRFVLLRHELPPESANSSHWDFMLERNGALLTWRLTELPKSWPQGNQTHDANSPTSVAATRLPDHRLDYLEYEGSVSGARGKVIRVARGDYRVLAESEAELLVELHSDSLTGRVTLMQQSGDSWTLTKDSAPPARD
jgi:hypothetical protein